MWEEEIYNRQMPKRLVKDFDISVNIDGKWTVTHQVRDNHKRLVKLDINQNIQSIKIENIKTWDGLDKCNIFSFEINN